MQRGVACYLDLPPAVGRVRLTGRVVWTALRGGERTLEGDRRYHYQTGIEFNRLTVEQQQALAGALETLKAASDAKDRLLSH
jgi:hypothetical protein